MSASTPVYSSRPGAPSLGPSILCSSIRADSGAQALLCSQGSRLMKVGVGVKCLKVNKNQGSEGLRS